VKIVSARTTAVGTPWRELVFLELQADTGLVGTSEVRMVSRTETLLACLGELAPRHVIGIDPFDVEQLAWNIQRAEYDRPGEVAQSALACFDVACWDLMGQSLGVPVWKLLGGKFHARVPAYANGWYQTEREPVQIAALAKTVVAKGYRAMKLDPFGHASAELPRSRRSSSHSRLNGSKSPRRRRIPSHIAPCARRHICRSRPANALTPWRTFAGSSKAASSTSSRWTSRISVASCR
jgi:galactonate dehydratase